MNRANAMRFLGSRTDRRRLLAASTALGGAAAPPPGVADFSEDAFSAWKTEHDLEVACEAVAWPQLHDTMATNFASGTHVHDIVYVSGWAPEFAQFLAPLNGMIPEGLRADLPPSSIRTVTTDDCQCQQHPAVQSRRGFVAEGRD